MIPEEPLHTAIHKKLQYVDGDRVAGYAGDHSVLIGFPELLTNFSRSDLCVYLIQWSYDFPNATNLLLLAVARCQDPSVYNHVANALVSSLPTWGEDRDCSIGAGEVLSMAFHQFHGYTRDFVADRYEVYRAHNLKEGVDYHALGTLSDDEKWDEHTPLPKPDTNRAIKCLLRQQGIPCGKLDEAWDEPAKRGLAYFQLLNDLESTGEPDAETRAVLEEVYSDVLSEQP